MHPLLYDDVQFHNFTTTKQRHHLTTGRESRHSIEYSSNMWFTTGDTDLNGFMFGMAGGPLSRIRKW